MSACLGCLGDNAAPLVVDVGGQKFGGDYCQLCATDLANALVPLIEMFFKGFDRTRLAATAGERDAA